ncbi:MAG: MFS transporter [Janthinobacterium lividum]
MQSDAVAAERRRFIPFLCARGASSLAFQMLSVAIGWQMYRLTGSAFDLGLVGLVQFLPMICLTLVIGHVADRFDRRMIVAICMAVEAATAFFLAVAVADGWLTKVMMFLVVALVGAARAFESPTGATLVTGLVARDRLQRATAWSTSVNQTAQIAGPAVGGLVYAVSPTAAFVSVGVLCALGCLFTAGLKLAARPISRAPVTLESLFSGINFIRRTPVILGTISLDLFAVLLGGATALLPIFAKDILHAGPWGLGVLRSAPAVGALAMSVYLAHRPLAGAIGKILFGALFAFGAATIVFALSASLPLSAVALCVLGAADAVSVVVRLTLVQMRTPDEMLGRVSAVNMLFIGTSNQLGEFESGVTASWFGAVPAAVLGGVGTIVISLLWMFLFPSLRRMRSLTSNDGEEVVDAAAAETTSEQQL